MIAERMRAFVKDGGGCVGIGSGAINALPWCAPRK